MKAPTTGPTTLPLTEERITKATAYCCSSDSYMSATIPKVTEPPAKDKPPRNLPARIVPKFGASAHGICQIYTSARLVCSTPQRPSSSLHRAQSSHPNVYASKNAI